MIRTYSELVKLSTFEERFRYLKLDSAVGVETFGYDRWINQAFYASPEWKSVRRAVILRDSGCDLGIEDRPIFSSVTVHHINPLTMDDILGRLPNVFDADNLICVSASTHRAIHYGDEGLLIGSFVQDRKPNDTTPWRK